MFSAQLLLDAVVAGILIGGFYAAVALGISIAFGMLDVVNIAHPAFVVLGSFIAWMMGEWAGFDPVLTGILFSPVFFLLGMVIYRVYYESFEKRGQESLRGLAFFFGIMFVTEVALILAFGVDYRLVNAPYIGETLTLGPVSLPFRLLVPFVLAVLLVIGFQVYLTRTFTGRAIMAVSQDQLALRLMAADPVRIKQFAFGLSIATCAIAGALLVMIGPVQPSIGRDYIGRIFAICVLGGMGSVPGTLAAGLILGVVESLTATFYGPSWAPAVSFGILLLVLAFRPSGLFGR